MHRPFALLFTLLLSLSLADARKPPSKSAILLSSVRALTLRADSFTTGRRNPPIPQLTCTSGSGCAHSSIDILRCTNSGPEYGAEDIQWTCQASLPPEFKLGSTEVVCEGYDSPEDPYVLRGSCGVEYRLLLTEEGEAKYGSGGSWFGGGGGGGGGGEKGVGEKVFVFIFWAIFIGIVGLILYSTFFSPPTGPRQRGPGWNGGYGGGGDDDDNNDPPPPYTPRRDPWTKANVNPSSSQQSNESWRPGFWTGTAAGAAATYAMNRNRGNDPAQAGPSNWFGSGGGRQAPRSGFGGGEASPPQGAGSRYESTGFGGTRRR